MTAFRTICSVLIVCLLTLWLTGCTPQSAGVVQHLTASQTRDLIESNTGNPDFVILDVRTPREYSQGHIAGAVLLDFHSAKFSTRLRKLDKSKTYLIYCRTGNRSSKTLKLIEKMEFQTVYHLHRGIVEWYAKKLPVVGS